jgi:hypothetical protein
MTTNSTQTKIGTKTANTLERIAISECQTNKSREGNLTQIQATLATIREFGINQTFFDHLEFQVSQNETLANNQTFRISLNQLQTQIQDQYD